jgi:AcrR family transcriptional regulator
MRTLYTKKMARRGDSGLPASVETTWGLAAGHGRGRPPTLSLDRIVEAALRLASTHGLGSVSMARVAAELGSSTMALYRHVATKKELLALMVDAALGPPPATATEGWRDGLAQWAWAQHERIRTHPWTVRVPISGPPTTPNQVAWLEAALCLLAPTGLAEHEKASTVLLLSGYIRGEASLTAEIEAHFTSADPDRAMSAYADLLRRLLEPERFPALHTLLAAGVFDHADHPDVEFAFGLERILDGIGTLVAAGS